MQQEIKLVTQLTILNQTQFIQIQTRKAKREYKLHKRMFCNMEGKTVKRKQFIRMRWGKHLEITITLHYHLIPILFPLN